MSDDRYFDITVEYRANQVPRDVDEAIRRIMRKAAHDITAKLALLSDPRVVSIRAQQWDEDRYKDMLADESSPDQS